LKSGENGNKMKLKGIIWLEKFVDKLLRKHNITTDEAEEVFVNSAHY
jgi:hypothetical protein